MALKMIVLVIALLFVTDGFLPAIAAAEDEGRAMRVTATSLNVRSGPETAKAVVRSVPEGTIVTIVEDQGEWRRIRFSDGLEGWALAKYLAPVGEGGAPGRAVPPPRGKLRAESPRYERIGADDGGGGSVLGPILKWTTLAGAVVAGGLAYSEKLEGDDAYEEYKDLFAVGKVDDAEVKWIETGDHDEEAHLYAIAGGSLFGLFLLQQFVFAARADDDRSRAERATELPFAWELERGDVRVGLTIARF